jgi:hypothetical protein
MTDAAILAIPSLHSWFNADPALFNAGTGVYADKGPRGNNWKNTTSSQRPTLTANWRSTGQPALTFDGVDDRIPADHVTPVGPITVVAVVDIVGVAGSPCIVGNNSGSTYQGLKLYTNANRPLFYSRSAQAFIPSAPSANVPHIFVGNLDPMGGTVNISADGGSWVTTAIGASSVNFGSTLQIGAYQLPTTDLWTGSVADVLIFTDPLKDTADLATVIATMKAKYGIP